SGGPSSARERRVPRTPVAPAAVTPVRNSRRDCPACILASLVTCPCQSCALRPARRQIGSRSLNFSLAKARRHRGFGQPTTEFRRSRRRRQPQSPAHHRNDEYATDIVPRIGNRKLRSCPALVKHTSRLPGRVTNSPAYWNRFALVKPFG